MPPPGAVPEPAGLTSPAALLRAINAQHPRLRTCLEAGLRPDALPAGEVVIRFTLQPEGRLEQLTVHGSNLPAQIVHCVEGVFRELSLPRPSQPLRVEYPLQLAP